MKVLLVVDMQNDFVTGTLASNEAQAIVPNVVDKIKNFDGKVLYTRDTHDENYLNTQEGKRLPVMHCIEGSIGHEIVPEIIVDSEENAMNKYAFGCIDLPAFITSHCPEVTEVTMVGLCTDICVISNSMILKAAFPEIEVVVDASCCAGVTPESHKNALEAMKMCQITVVNE